MLYTMLVVAGFLAGVIGTLVYVDKTLQFSTKALQEALDSFDDSKKAMQSARDILNNDHKLLKESIDALIRKFNCNECGHFIKE